MVPLYTAPSQMTAVVPFSISFILIKGMLIQLAPATAANGTSLPKMGGSLATEAFNERAVPKAPPVANKYDCPN